ncbi:MAG: zinc metallopeptidase [Ahrensia sp.]|nr:zinc metallopeptidase [Ahrensia sp.]
MAVLGLLAASIGLAVLFGPQLWISHQMKKHATPRDDFPGTGGELAEHLAEHFELNGVGVERFEGGDHYDPETRTVRLSPDNFDGTSLTAVAVAAHEIGHAIQHHKGERGLALRQRLVGWVVATDKIASIFFLAAPVLGAVIRTPAAFFGLIATGVLLLGIRILVHLVTLPVEYDASFNKALPILKEGGYLKDEDLGHARGVLKAAAFTYVAQALTSLLDLARWIRILR